MHQRREAVPGALVDPVREVLAWKKLKLGLVEGEQDLEQILVPWVVGDGELSRRTDEVVDALLAMRERASPDE